MAVMSGNVNVTVRVDGVGSAPSKVEESKKAIKSLGDEAQKSGSVVSSLKDRMGSLKTSVGPINAVRETFENLRGNLGLVGLAVGGLVTVFGALIDAIDTPRVDATVERFNRLSTAVAGSTRELAGLLSQASQLGAALGAVDSEIAQIDADVAEREGRWADALELRERATRMRAADRIKEHEDKLAEADDVANKAELGVRKAREQKRETDTEIAHLTELIEMRRAQGLGTQLQEQQLVAVRIAQGGVITNLRIAEDAYAKAARSVDGYSRKLAALDRQLDSLDKPAAEKPVKSPGGGGVKTRVDEAEKRYRDAMNARPWMDPGGDRHLVGQDDINAGMVPDFLARNDNFFERASQFDARDQARRSEMDRRGRMAADIRDFSASLSDSIPGMSEFSGALRDIGGAWGEVAAANDNATEVYSKYLEGRATEAEYLKAAKDARTAEARGAIASIGAIATAGAEQIKNERLRAGVLSTIHLGLGTALMFVPGAQQEAFGHLAGAAILAGVALFGGSSGGSSRGGSRSGGSRSVARTLSDNGGVGGAVTLNVFGGWFGTSHPAETAAALHSLMQRGSGSGYVPRAA